MIFKWQSDEPIIDCIRNKKLCKEEFVIIIQLVGGEQCLYKYSNVNLEYLLCQKL